MPQHKSAIKRVRQQQKRYTRRHAQRSTSRTMVKRVLQSEDKETALERYKKAVAYLDRMASKNVIHKNKAANEKSKMTTFLNNNFSS